MSNSEDKADHSRLARSFVTKTNFPVAVPNYRLTPRTPLEEDSLRHPSHAEDILQFLTFLISWKGPAPYDPRKIYVIGHSCSAHMLSAIFLDSSKPTPSLSPSADLFDAVQAVVMSEGIYDIDLLLASFPHYRQWFVEPTFGSRQSYAEFSTTSAPLRTHKPQMRWLVIHSKGDTLVDVLQSDAMYNHLCQLHTLAAVQTKAFVFKNMDELDGEHNCVVRGETYVQIVGNFILEDHSAHFSQWLTKIVLTGNYITHPMET
jgi:acetyl esterase/lipase